MTALLLTAAPMVPVVAAVAIALGRPGGPSPARWAVRATFVACAAAVGLAVFVWAEGPVSMVAAGADGTAAIGLYADRVGVVLALLTSGVGLVVQSFAARALRGDLRERRFFALTALLTGATTSVALSATLGLLAVSWIVTGSALAALVAHRGKWDPAVRAARRVRRSFFVGDAALATAAVVTLVSVGEIDLRSLDVTANALASQRIPALGTDTLTVIAVLLAVAGVSRSALVPLHRWLPATLAAPTPVSALLHAGVVNGAGVLLVRLAPVFGASPTATHLALVAGVITVLYATAVMLVRSDVKGNLAWSTAGQMGFMTVQLAVGAFSAALFHIVGHGMYKAALFLGSGGAVTAHLRHRHRPAPQPRTPRPVRLATALLVPAAALFAAYQVVDPHLPTAGDLLVVVFAWATAARAADGWLRAAPFTPMPTVVLVVAGTVVAVFGYVAGLALFEGFVTPALPVEVPAAVSPTVLGTILAATASMVVAVSLAPGKRGQRLRVRIYAFLLSTAAPVPKPDDQRAPRGSSAAGAVLAPADRGETILREPARPPRRSR
jgi:NADH:ubiquinone oxidoreductase subunit 5 (subunit L)/multisubunit Na+/H+ antiporter MnhA subunit